MRNNILGRAISYLWLYFASAGRSGSLILGDSRPLRPLTGTFLHVQFLSFSIIWAKIGPFWCFLCDFYFVVRRVDWVRRAPRSSQTFSSPDCHTLYYSFNSFDPLWVFSWFYFVVRRVLGERMDSRVQQSPSSPDCHKVIICHFPCFLGLLYTFRPYPSFPKFTVRLSRSRVEGDVLRSWAELSEIARERVELLRQTNGNTNRIS